MAAYRPRSAQGRDDSGASRILRRSGRVGLRVFTVDAVAALLLALSANSNQLRAASAQSTQVDCSGQPFASQPVSSAILASCGVEQFPLLSTSALPDGGTAYNYDVNGTADHRNSPLSITEIPQAN
jgi:hypothetical protein